MKSFKGIPVLTMPEKTVVHVSCNTAVVWYSEWQMQKQGLCFMLVGYFFKDGVRMLKRCMWNVPCMIKKINSTDFNDLAMSMRLSDLGHGL